MNKYVKRYCIDAMGGMAQGLFASLLVGTIVKTLGQQLIKLFPALPVEKAAEATTESAAAETIIEGAAETVAETAEAVAETAPGFFDYICNGLHEACQFLINAGTVAMGGSLDIAGKTVSFAAVTGAAMAIGIGYAMKVDPLVLFSLITVGAAASVMGGAGGPLAVLILAIVAAELGMLVSKKTKVDILVTPIVTILGGVLISYIFAPFIGQFANAFGVLIMKATELHPFVMGIIVSVIVGILLTLPISSAAICAALGLTGLAGGAGVAGCCAQMVGFAVLSYRENKVGGLLSQGLGTSMLQMPNIVKNPLVWLPAIITSAITGPIATCIFKMEMNGAPICSGMGTCGMVGPIGVITGWQNATAFDWFGLVMVCIVLPAVLCWALGLLFRKIGWIKEGDLTLA